MKKLKQKKIGKRCPECEDGYLYSVFKYQDNNGAEYNEEYIECHSCNYSVKLKNKRNKFQKE